MLHFAPQICPHWGWASRCRASAMRQLQQLQVDVVGLTGSCKLGNLFDAAGDAAQGSSHGMATNSTHLRQQQQQLCAAHATQSWRPASAAPLQACLHQHHSPWQQQPQQQQHRSLLTSCSAPLSQQALSLQRQAVLPHHALCHHQQQHHQHAFQLQQLRGLKQLRPYAEAPKLPPKFKRPNKDGRLNRMVIRVPPQVQLTIEDGLIKLAGKAGHTSLKLSMLDPSGLVAWRCLSQSAAEAAAGPGSGSLLLMVGPSKRHWRAIQTHIDNAVHGVMQGYLVGLTVQGVGYRLEPVSEDVVQAAVRARKGNAAAADSSVKHSMFWEQEAEKTNIAYPHKQPAKAVRLKVGFTKAAVYPLPEGVRGLFVKPTLMYLYGIDKHLVTNTAAAIRGVRPPNPYTGNGIQLVGETIRLRQRAGSK